MVCKSQKIVGADVVLEYAIGCGDRLPIESEWKRMGSMRTKEFSIEWDSADTTDDGSKGRMREMMATFLSLSMSGDGTVKVSGEGSANAKEIAKHIADPVATGGQPTVWMRMTFPDLTYIAYMMFSSYGRSAPFDDVVTFSMEASATASDFKLIVEDTPDPDAPDATSVGILPTSFSITVGKTFDVQAVVLPVDASQNLRWTSSAPSIASVNAVTGEVNALAAGTATITATSEAAGVSGTSAVTVQPQVAGISVTSTAISVEDGSTAQITATVVPTGAPSGFTYASMNPSVATVSSSGLVTGVNPGTTVVRVTSVSRPGVTQDVNVTVTPDV